VWGLAGLIVALPRQVSDTRVPLYDFSNATGFGIAVAVTVAISFAIGVSTFFLIKGYVPSVRCVPASLLVVVTT
jgi:hypothetical protein